MARTRKSLAAAKQAAAAALSTGPPENALTTVFNLDDDQSHQAHADLLNSLQASATASTSTLHDPPAYIEGGAEGEGADPLDGSQAHHHLDHLGQELDTSFLDEPHQAGLSVQEQGDMQAAQEAFWAALPLGDHVVPSNTDAHHAALDELAQAMSQAHDPDHPHYDPHAQHNDPHHVEDPNEYHFGGHDPSLQHQQQHPHHDPHPMDEQHYTEQSMLGHPQFSGGYGHEGSPIIGPDGEIISRKETHVSDTDKPSLKEVERRRRETINTGINRLAAIVPTTEKNKAAILEKAAQYIELLRRNETQNIERWTMERNMMDQSLADMKRVVEEETELRVRAEARCQRLIDQQKHHQAQLAAAKAGAPQLPPLPAAAAAPAPRQAPKKVAPAATGGPRSRGPMGLPAPTSTYQATLPTMPTPPRSARTDTDDLFGDASDEGEDEIDEIDEIDEDPAEQKRKAAREAAAAKKRQRVR